MQTERSTGDTTQEVAEYLLGLIRRAFDQDPFQTLCALIRVGGSTDANWDPFEESERALADFEWMIDRAQEERGEVTALRIALLSYCQAVEMSAPHELLANLLRIRDGQECHVRPFLHVTKKHSLIKWVPPSASTKFNELRQKAKSVGEEPLADFIEGFYNSDIRNAFSHSDYIITDEDFRWTETGVARRMSLDELYELLNRCFCFYRAFFPVHEKALTELGGFPRYHKWANYLVLEILTDDDEKACGFQVHFSNGSVARFARTPTGVDAVNLWFDEDGSVRFFAGNLDALEETWKLNGEPVSDWDAL